MGHIRALSVAQFPPVGQEALKVLRDLSQAQRMRPGNTRGQRKAASALGRLSADVDLDGNPHGLTGDGSLMVEDQEVQTGSVDPDRFELFTPQLKAAKGNSRGSKALDFWYRTSSYGAVVRELQTEGVVNQVVDHYRTEISGANEATTG